MIRIPDEIKRLFTTDNVKKSFRVIFPNGEYPDMVNDKIEQESVVLTESISSQSVIQFGLCESPMIEFVCHGMPNFTRKTIKCQLEVDISSLDAEDIAQYGQISADVPYPYYVIPYGTYIVKECKKSGDSDKRKVVGYSKIINNKKYFSMPDNFEYLRCGWRSADTINFTDKMFLAYLMPEVAESVADEVSDDSSEPYIEAWYNYEEISHVYPSQTNIRNSFEYYDDGSWSDMGRMYLRGSSFIDGDKCIIINPCTRGSNYQSHIKSASTESLDAICTIKYIDTDINDNYIKEIIDSIKASGIETSETINVITNYLKNIRDNNSVMLYYDGSHEGELEPSSTWPIPFKYSKTNYGFYRHEISGSESDTLTMENGYPWSLFGANLGQSVLKTPKLRNNAYSRFLDYRCNYTSVSGGINNYRFYSNGYHTINRFYVCGFKVYIGTINTAVSINDDVIYNKPTSLGYTRKTFTNSGNILYTLNRNSTKTINTYRLVSSTTDTYTAITQTFYYISESQINDFIDNFFKSNYSDIIQSYLEIQGKFGMIDRTTGQYKVIDLTDHLSLYPSPDIYPSQDLYPRGSELLITRSMYKLVEYEDSATRHYDRISCTWTDASNNEHYQYYDIVDHDAPDYDPDDYQTYSLSENYFIKNKYYTVAQVTEILQTLGEKIKGFQYFPCDIECVGLPYVETGDGISVVTKDSGFTSFVLRRTIKGIQSLEDNIEAR